MRKLFIAIFALTTLLLMSFTVQQTSTAANQNCVTVSISGASVVYLPGKGQGSINKIWYATNYNSNLTYEWYYNGTKVGEGASYTREYKFSGYTINTYHTVEVHVSCPCCPCCNASASKSVHVMDDTFGPGLTP